MTDTAHEQALLLMGCPEVPVQMGIGIYLAHMLRTHGRDVTVAGNPSVLQLLRTSDPGRCYVTSMTDLDRCIGEIVEKRRDYDLVIVFAHNDAGISYAATMRHISGGRIILLIFGRNAEALAGQVDFPCETIVAVAVHNPIELKKKIDEAFRWRASRS